MKFVDRFLQTELKRKKQEINELDAAERLIQDLARAPTEHDKELRRLAQDKLAERRKQQADLAAAKKEIESQAHKTIHDIQTATKESVKAITKEQHDLQAQEKALKKELAAPPKDAPPPIPLDLRAKKILQMRAEYQGSNFAERLLVDGVEKTEQAIAKGVEKVESAIGRGLEKLDTPSAPKPAEMPSTVISPPKEPPAVQNPLLHLEEGSTLKLSQKIKDSKPPNDWKNWDDVKSELEKLIKEKCNNKFPTRKKLVDLGYGELVSAIKKELGGFLKVRERMGYSLDGKPYGYWKNWDNLKRELINLIKTKFKGKFPTEDMLRNKGYGGLENAIDKYYGGFHAVQERLGYKPTKKPMGYWKNWENLKLELKPLITKKFKKKFPIEKQLQKLGHYDLVDAILKYHGGFTKVQEKLGYQSEKKPLGYWQIWENFEKELKYLIATEFDNKFPSLKQLRIKKHADLDTAITRHHGGYREVQKKMGFDPKRKSWGYWHDWENVEKELNHLIATIFKKNFPTREELQLLGYNSLAVAISTDHGGFAKVQERMGFDIKRRPNEYWKDWENVKNELQKIIINEFKGQFPTFQMLLEAKHSDILYGMNKYHGGMNEIRTKMGYDIPNWSERASYYAKRGLNTEKIVKEILKEWADLNGFPSSSKAQTKIGPGRYLELVCGKDKTYGIDITNSKTKKSVESKWKLKEYHKFVDELWVIVVSNKFNSKQFKDWNQVTPENVLVIDGRKLAEFFNDFVKCKVPFEIPLEKLRKIEVLARCTFENKETIKEKFRQGKRMDPQKNINEFHDVYNEKS